MVCIYKPPIHYFFDIQLVLPVLLDNINRKMKYWGKEGMIDLFQDVYGMSRSLTFSWTNLFTVYAST